MSIQFVTLNYVGVIDTVLLELKLYYFMPMQFP